MLLLSPDWDIDFSLWMQAQYVSSGQEVPSTSRRDERPLGSPNSAAEDIVSSFPRVSYRDAACLRPPSAQPACCEELLMCVGTQFR